MTLMAQAVDRSLSLAGWRPVGTPPPHQKLILVAAPHTSNWDGLLMLAAFRHFRIEFAWMAKHTLFRGPGGPFFRGLGGISTDRRFPGGMVAQMAEEFAKRDHLWLALSPEGTRGHTDHWKSGFYRIAQAAGVPICLSFLDYGRREFGFGPTFMPSGNLRADMDKIRAFYADKAGCVPANFGPIRLREEDAATGGAAAQAASR